MNINDFIQNIELRVKERMKEHELASSYFDHTKERYKLNKNKSSYTIKLCNSAIIKITTNKNDIILEISTKYIKLFENNDGESTNTDERWMKVLFNDDNTNKIIRNIKQIFDECYKDETVDHFGCCSRFNECSDERKCIHPDIKFSQGCGYKINLDQGKIFYGKNRNI